MNGDAMKTTTKRTNDAPKTTPGFSILLQEDTELSAATLIAEMHGGGYEPIGHVMTIREARTVVNEDMRLRMRQLEDRDGPEPACPELYVVWARGLMGRYHIAARILP